MFWSRSGREARRRKVLDELLELDPQDRPGRLESAVASGDVRAEEVQDALQLVGRLDALRVLTLPSKGLKTALPGAVRIHPAPATDEDTSSDSKGTEPAGSETTVDAVPKAKARRRRRSRARATVPSEEATVELVAPVDSGVPEEPAVPAEALVEASPAEASPAEVPLISLDLVEAAARQVARELSARKSHGAARSSRARRLHAAALSDSQRHLDQVPAGDAPSEVSWPDISWLRP
jgi:hypothetical protein